MTLEDAIKARRSIRKFEDKPISDALKTILEEKIAEINDKTGLHIQLITNKPEAFQSFLSHYGGFENAVNYIALVGKKSAFLDEMCGYYGEQLVLLAQQIGLSTCWVGGTFNRRGSFYACEKDEKLCLIIAVGYAAEDGKVHKSKERDQITKAGEDAPDWFWKGVDAALLAPTAINQQKFLLTLTENGKVTAKAGMGPFSKVDLGIVKYHFEIGSGKGKEIWN